MAKVELRAEQTPRMTEEQAPALLTTIAVDPVSLAVFDELLTGKGTVA